MTSDKAPVMLPGLSVNAGRLVLHITPHPDDEALGCPGALLRMSAGGWRVVNLLVALGRPSDAQRRRREAEEASRRAQFDLVVADPPLRISRTDDLAASQEQLTTVVADIVQEYRPAIVVTSSPHDGHHGHELVGRATIKALSNRRANGEEVPVLWLWSLWSDLTFPTLIAPYDQDILDLARHVLAAHSGEIGRNNYLRLLPARAQVNAVLGFERVHGFGSAAPEGLIYADLLTECILTEREWHLGSQRTLGADEELAGVASGRDIGWWLKRPSLWSELGNKVRGEALLPL